MEKNKYLIFYVITTILFIKINNEKVPRCESTIHLGHLLNTRNTKNALIEHSINEFNKSFYEFEVCNTIIKSKLFPLFHSSMYGSQLWDLTN